MKRQYTGRERIMAAFQREYTDRVPINVGLGPNFIGLTGHTLNEYMVDPEKAFNVLRLAYEMMPSDMVPVPGDPYLPSIEAATYEQTHGPGARRPRRLAEKSALKELEVRDPKQSKRYVTYLDMCRRVNSTFKDAAPMALVPGPWSTAVELRGAEDLMYDTADDPEFVHQTMRFTTDLAKARGEVVAETGVIVRYGDPSSGCSLISPKIYQQFVKPYHQELADFLKDREARVSLHICGFIDPIMEDLVSLSMDMIELDGPSSLKKMVEVSAGKVVIRGNLSAELFDEGTKEQVEAAVKECIDTAAGGAAYVISPGCSIPITAPLENIRYFWEAAQKYGRYM